MITNGCVGYFDILGFKAIMANNDLAKVSQILEGLFETLPDRTMNAVVSPIESAGAREWTRRHLQAIEFRFVSDGIFVGMPMSDATNDSQKIRVIAHFLAYVAKFMRLAFDEGLPLRGAISHGDFVLSRYSFVGNPILECIEVEKWLQMAGCAITPVTTDLLLNLGASTSEPQLLQRFMFPFLTSIKGVESVNLPVVDWYLPTLDWGTTQQDLHRYVMESFQKHNKPIPDEDLVKVENTETMLRKSLERKV